MLPRNVRMTNSYTDEFRNELKILALSLEKLNCVGHSLGSGLGTIGEFSTEKLLHDLAEGLRCQNRLHRLILIRDLSKRAGGRGERTRKIREWNTVFMLVKSGIKAKWKTCLINWEYGMQYFGTCFAWNSKSASIPISPSRRDCKRNFNLFFIQTVEFWSFYDTPPPPTRISNFLRGWGIDALQNCLLLGIPCLDRSTASNSSWRSIHTPCSCWWKCSDCSSVRVGQPLLKTWIRRG